MSKKKCSHVLVLPVGILSSMSLSGVRLFSSSTYQRLDLLIISLLHRMTQQVVDSPLTILFISFLFQSLYHSSRSSCADIKQLIVLEDSMTEKVKLFITKKCKNMFQV